MCTTSIQMASASTMWMSRRVRVASLSTTTTHEQNRPPMRPWQGKEIPTRLRPWQVDPPRRDPRPVALGDLNGGAFWSQPSSVYELAKLEEKEDILKVVSTFLFISKKSVFLFSAFARKIVADKFAYSAAELGLVMNAFAQLGFLEESFCMQVADRVIGDAKNSGPRDLVNLADGYASTRCYVSSVVSALTNAALPQIPNFSPFEVSLLASSWARLSVRDDSLFDRLADRFLEIAQVEGPPDANGYSVLAPLPTVTAREVTLMAYSFAKMRGSGTPELLQNRIVDLAQILVRDFTAKELQMLVTGLHKWGENEKRRDLLGAVSEQAQRRIAQFSAESLIHLLRGMLGMDFLDQALITRAVCQLPRIGQNLKPAEIVQFYNLFKDMHLRSQVALSVLQPLAIAKAQQISPADWILILQTSPCEEELAEACLSATDLGKLTIAQLVSLVECVGKHQRMLPFVMKQIESKNRLAEMSANDAGDLYCQLVSVGVHEDSRFVPLMQRILAKSIPHK